MAVRSLRPLLAALLVVMATAGVPKQGRRSPLDGARIVNGAPAFLGQLPHQALVLGDGVVLCGGSLVSEHSVLTAAHCTVNFKKYHIRLGAIHMMEHDDTMWTTEAIWARAHPEFNAFGKSVNDVAVIFLPEDAPLSSYISLVELPSFSDLHNTFEGQRALVSGWGLDADCKSTDKFTLLHL
ncbi:chymotrypsin-like [Schistocerca gregaria]|uniref:chymotrypsin-like n=1 Tax=Schistocerca gregaria TaxID=7010 RepID=UPI00211ED617|nr:chymotrypsin-like [Schistocerca gregaria]